MSRGRIVPKDLLRFKSVVFAFKLNEQIQKVSVYVYESMSCRSSETVVKTVTLCALSCFELTTNTATFDTRHFIVAIVMAIACSIS